jgi:hypothetical protein
VDEARKAPPPQKRARGLQLSLADKYKKKKPPLPKKLLLILLFILIVAIGIAMRDGEGLDGLLGAWVNVWDSSFMGR